MAIYILLASLIPCFAGIFYFVNKFYKKKKAFYEKTISDLKNTDVINALEFATSDQLINELHQRVRCPFILITPVETQNENGLNIAVHNIEPQKAIAMLGYSAAMASQELVNRGIFTNGFNQNEDN